MKYPQLRSKEELKLLEKMLSFTELQVLNDVDVKNGGPNVFLITNEQDEEGKDVVIVYGSGEVGEYNSEDAREYVLGEMGTMKSFDLYFDGEFTKIKPDAFYCVPVKYCLIPETMEEIGENAFKESGLESIHTNNALKYIRRGAFEGCESLKEINLPSTVEIVEENAFYGCAEGIRIIIDKPKGSLAGAPWGADNALIIWEEDGVYISDDGELLWRYLGDAKEYTIPDGIKRTRHQAFSRSKIEKITIPDSLEKIGGLAFEATPLKEVVWGKGVKELELWTFADCENLKTLDIPFGPEELKSTFLRCHSLERVTIPNSVKRLSGGVFSACYSLKELYIPESVEEMSGDCFRLFSYSKYKNSDREYESELERLEVDPDNKHFVCENGAIYSKDKSRLVCATTIGGKSFTVPDSVKTIDNYAFCTNLNWDRVIIPDGVKINGSSKLFEGNNIEYVEIPAAMLEARDTVFGKCNIKRLVIRGKAKNENDVKYIAYNCNIEECVFE